MRWDVDRDPELRDFRQAMESSDPQRRTAALAGMRLQPGIEAEIVRALAAVSRGDPSPEVRVQAVRALGRFLQEGRPDAPAS